MVGIIHSWFSAEKTRKVLEGRSTFAGNILASLLGIVTPFCSCSAIPLFLGFVESVVPLGITFSFLIAAPMINEVAVILLFGIFGWKVALIYVLTGLATAILAGWTIAAGIVPIVSVLIEKGASLGTSLAFMMLVICLMPYSENSCNVMELLQNLKG